VEKNKGRKNEENVVVVIEEEEEVEVEEKNEDAEEIGVGAMNSKLFIGDKG
jgi:hypothetical protein